MKISVFFRSHKRVSDNAKIFMALKPVFKRFSRLFEKGKNAKIRQEYIGGEDFGLHRAGNKHVILVCDVQRRPQRMYCFDGRRNVRTATVVSVNSVQQKRR